MTKKLLLIGLLCILAGCTQSKQASVSPESPAASISSQPTESQSVEAQPTESQPADNQAGEEPNPHIVPVHYDSVEITKAKLSPVQTKDVNKVLRTENVQDGTINLYTKKSDEHNIFASIKTSSTELEIDGLIGYDDPSAINVSQIDFNGIPLIKVEGFEGASAPITQYLSIEKDKPNSFWQTESHVVEQDVDGDGKKEFISTAGGTIPETTIYKFTSASQAQAANLNKLMNGSVVFMKNNQFDVYYGLDKKAEHYDLTPEGMKFMGYIK
ncbi:hypothetical protein D7Z26_16125 [Cohnella endophytica]|uniref:Lipoprotein n=1 Tax=Cohnella endophytica TaxID=2419778 RepID=A0A494XR70_9BACL|nr:hypothetical protein [Cohnella endophytica]RKP51326.1 hypothetical protein D7Z26_16125 [Cohnella endophytica]